MTEHSLDNEMKWTKHSLIKFLYHLEPMHIRFRPNNFVRLYMYLEMKLDQDNDQSHCEHFVMETPSTTLDCYI